MKKVALTVSEFAIIRSALTTSPQKILLFGSRVNGGYQKYSDLDVCLKGAEPISFEELARLRAIFSESDLPFAIDLVDYHRISLSFQAMIDSQAVDISNISPGECYT